MSGYNFDGSEQYVEIPAYSTLGNPAVYRDISYDTDNEDGYVVDLSEPIVAFGKSGSNFHFGNLENFSIVDISPIQETYGQTGDGTFKLTFPVVDIKGGFAIDFDWRRTASASDFTLLTGKNALRTITSSIVIEASGDLVLTDLNGVTSTVVDAFDGVADGQHCHVRIRAVQSIDLEEGETNADENHLIVVIDGIETARLSVPGLDYFVRFEETGTLPIGTVLQGMSIETERGEEWVLPLAEASGVTANNTNTNTRNNAYFTNVQPFSNDLTVAGGSEPPPPPPPPPSGDRQDVVFFSGGETGAIQSSSNDIDGWGIQAFATGHQAEQVSVVNNISRAGNNCIKFYYNYGLWGDDANGKRRSEVRKPGNIFLVDGQLTFVGWSMFMPDNADMRTIIQVDQPNCSHFQWHFSDTSTSQMHLRGGRYEGNFGTYSQGDFGPIVLGVWVDWVMEVLPSTSGNGYCKIWKNAASAAETPIYQRTGSNLKANLPDTRLDFKFGIYRGASEWGGANAETKYLDEVRIAIGPNANFNSVKPG